MSREAAIQSTSVRDGKMLINAHRWLANVSVIVRSLIRDYRRMDGRWDQWSQNQKDSFLEDVVIAQPMFEEWLDDELMFTAGEWRSVMKGISLGSEAEIGRLLTESIRARFDDIMRTIVDEA